ncbi:MAG: ABC transporter permease [Verrucomicrobia bacterium CAG:312_58_20]|nr:MAG: ABC transporter permease [Verrucomicrobia bacterium CAG:312_58_20]PWL64224.1 MAG: ABC transporter permease [Verrucomicrobiota bacterium]
MKARRILFSVAAFAAMLLIWEFAVRSFDFAEYMLPPPSEVAMYLWGAVCDLSLPKAVWVTGKRLFTGYAIGLCIGIPTGMLCSRFNIFKDTVGILALGLQALPSVCWVPLAIMWFGQEESAMLFVVVMGTVWSLILATQHGVANIPPIYLRAASTMGSRGFHTWLHVIAPAALPSIIGGMKQGWAFAWRSLMAAEIYVTILTGFGLGQLLHYGRELMRMDQVIGVMCVVIAIGLLIDKAVFSPIESNLRKRWGISSD